MTNKRIAQTNQQQKSEKSQASGILQRAAVRSVSDAEVQSTGNKEAQSLGDSAFSKDFSQVPVSTIRMPQITTKLMIGSVGNRYEQKTEQAAAEVANRNKKSLIQMSSVHSPLQTNLLIQRVEESDGEDIDVDTASWIEPGLIGYKGTVLDSGKELKWPPPTPEIKEDWSGIYVGTKEQAEGNLYPDSGNGEAYLLKIYLTKRLPILHVKGEYMGKHDIDQSTKAHKVKTKANIAQEELLIPNLGIQQMLYRGRIAEGEDEIVIPHALVKFTEMEIVKEYIVKDFELIQAKLIIGEVGDKYEQEADEVAKQVVQQINAPVQLLSQGQAVQGRIAEKTEKDELHMKPIVQHSVNAGVVATPDLETSINQAKNGGQSLADNIREPIEQAFSADFSKVKIHTDAQSNQLNQLMQAKAFTTGQDVFFRQGKYNPKSREGQELLIHELTHVVQQSGGAVQRSSLPLTLSAKVGSKTVQRTFDQNYKPIEDLATLNQRLDELNAEKLTLADMEVPGATDAMLDQAIASDNHSVYDDTSDLKHSYKEKLTLAVDKDLPTYEYDPHGDKHFPGGSQGTKFKAISQVVNPKLEKLISDKIGEIRRHANNQNTNYYYTLKGIPECPRGYDLTIQLTYKADSDTVNYHGYPDNNVKVYSLSLTKGGSEI